MEHHPKSQGTSPIVRTQSGDVRGATSEGIHVFKGVPFAAPPFGSNHLQPPQPPEPWEDVRDALTFGPKSPQVSYPPGIAEALAELVGSGEDCLTINVWTPELNTAARQPVMVWIPGGMFEFHATGAVSYCEGGRFARDGVVCVSIAYRVGLDGFLYLENGSPNLGLLDQVAALEWVQKNIAAFGGDPNNVTLFGESAGGMSAATLLAVPRAKGLFHRAIVESGPPKVNSIATAKRIGQRMTEILGIEATWEAVAALSSDRILEAQAKLRDDLEARPDPVFWGEVALSFLPWAPTVDGDVLPEHPVDIVRAGSAADIPLLIGSNTEETRLFFVSSGSIDFINQEALLAMTGAYGLSPEGLAAYRKWYPEASPGELLSTIQTDWYWRIPTIRLADAHAKDPRATTYMYEFAWRSPQMGGRLGAAHAVEMPFVFDMLGSGTEPLLGPAPPQGLADVMHRAWVAFATTGDPSWPRYESGGRTSMHFDIESRVLENPLKRELELWENVS